MCAPPDVKLVSGGGASPMPVELATISRANYRMLFGARKLGAIVRKGRQSTEWTGRNRRSRHERRSGRMLTRPKERSANSGFSVERQDLRRRKMRIARE